MDDSIPASTEEILALGENSISEDIIALAIAAVVKIAHRQGQSLEEIQEQVLHDDSILDLVQRRWLKDLVAKAWELLS
ncbi:MAG: hypothetical protein QNJ70_22935 [Xenococcaceae cyanobacterium MO_207.B15]|nr:hypothetical protein [Xenococcaceae cyanobacterium MO_207.B15]MDJ0745949.1 hypothetical protein [Xenococcaceae cyanobacterium MO_167.B27]